MVGVSSVGGSERNAGKVQLCSGRARFLLLGYFWHPEIFPLPHSSTGIHLPHRSASRGKPERCRHKVASPGGFAASPRGACFQSASTPLMVRKDGRSFWFQKEDLHGRYKKTLHSIVWLAGNATAGCKKTNNWLAVNTELSSKVHIYTN